jgi:hypothetical protein
MAIGEPNSSSGARFTISSILVFIVMDIVDPTHDPERSDVRLHQRERFFFLGVLFSVEERLPGRSP